MKSIEFLMKLIVNQLFMEIDSTFLIEPRVNKLNLLLNQARLNLLWK